MDGASFSVMRCRCRGGAAGFTLVEVVIAGAMLALLISGSLAGLTQINRWATSARLRTLALAVAQQRIDAIQTIPWQGSGARPAILTATTALNVPITTIETNIPLNNDPFNSASDLSSTFTDLDTQTNVTRTTVITNITPRTLRAVVTVTFSYRNRPHAVSLVALRAADAI
jgi:type II secretory pathway pseudopilin PulG